MIRPRTVQTAGILFCLLLGSLAQAGTLHFGQWRASAFGRSVAGNFCLLTDPAGFLRLDLSRETTPRPLDSRTVRDLLEWSGQGWCLVQGDIGEGTLGPWFERWDRLDRPLGIWLALSAIHLEPDGPSVAQLAAWGVRPRPGSVAAQPRPFFTTTGPVALRASFQVPGLARLAHDGTSISSVDSSPQASGFRGGHIRQGGGRGTSGEILTVERTLDAEGAVSSLTLRSSRKPGSMRLDGLIQHPVSYVVEEVFVPLWPLGDVLDFAPEEIGNPIRR